MQSKKKVQLAADCIHDNCSFVSGARIGLVLGTGLGGLCETFEQDFSIAYQDIPGFPTSTVQTHAGALSHGYLDGTPVWVLQGRFHLYEGYSAHDVCMGVRTLACLGVQTLLMTNAAGALNPHFSAGSLMCLSDQINFTGATPLEGPNEDTWGPRFPDMSRVYSERLQDLAMQASLDLGIRLEKGVYVGVRGPCLETPAETRAYKMLGGDAIGMSTVLEAMAARHMGLELLGVSCLTNKNLPDCMEETTLEEVIAMAGKASGNLALLLAEVVRREGRARQGAL